MQNKLCVHCKYCAQPEVDIQLCTHVKHEDLVRGAGTDCTLWRSQRLEDCELWEPKNASETG